MINLFQEHQKVKKTNYESSYAFSGRVLTLNDFKSG